MALLREFRNVKGKRPRGIFYSSGVVSNVHEWQGGQSNIERGPWGRNNKICAGPLNFGTGVARAGNWRGASPEVFLEKILKYDFGQLGAQDTEEYQDLDNKKNQNLLHHLEVRCH